MSKFLPGQSGNPRGRPKRPDSAARAQIEKAAPEILEAMIGLAKSGDVSAARVLLDRVMPALKAVDAPVVLPPGVDLSDLSGAPVAVLTALGQGALSPDQAGTIAAALAALVRVREATELEARIRALEESA